MEKADIRWEQRFSNFQKALTNCKNLSTKVICRNLKNKDL